MTGGVGVHRALDRDRHPFIGARGSIAVSMPFRLGRSTAAIAGEGDDPHGRSISARNCWRSSGDASFHARRSLVSGVGRLLMPALTAAAWIER